jgi:hypothetical protein
LILAFPLSLAYVVVVQRAMDVRILVRMGTKYALARGSVRVLRTALLVLIGIYFWQLARAPHLDAATSPRLVLLALLLSLVSPRIFQPVSKWIDRRFFREAHNAERVLNELSESVRTIVEIRPLLETVGRKISSSMHVARLAILVKTGAGYQVQYADGYETAPPRFCLVKAALPPRCNGNVSLSLFILKTLSRGSIPLRAQTNRNGESCVRWTHSCFSHWHSRKHWRGLSRLAPSFPKNHMPPPTCNCLVPSLPRPGWLLRTAV